jgi:hypothetical protein
MYGGDKLLWSVRLVYPSERLRPLGFRTRNVVGVRASKDAADAKPLIDDDRRFDTIRTARKTDVHDDEIGPLALREIERTGGCIRQTHTFQTSRAQVQLAVHCDEILIFHYENFRRGIHRIAQISWSRSDNYGAPAIVPI